MAREVRLPKLGQTMEEGTVVNCLIKAGDEIKRGDVIFEIETDKATLEMESPADGFVKHILVEVGQTLPVGAPMLVIGDKDEKVPQDFTVSPKSADIAAATPAVAASGAEPARPMETPAKVIASPRAKKLAEELGVDLSKLVGTGPAGKITEDDVKKAHSTSSGQAASTKMTTPTATAAQVNLGETIPLTKKQRLTAQRMVESKREIPCFYLSLRADVTDLVELR